MLPLLLQPFVPIPLPMPRRLQQIPRHRRPIVHISHRAWIKNLLLLVVQRQLHGRHAGDMRARCGGHRLLPPRLQLPGIRGIECAPGGQRRLDLQGIIPLNLRVSHMCDILMQMRMRVLLIGIGQSRGYRHDGTIGRDRTVRRMIRYRIAFVVAHASLFR